MSAISEDLDDLILNFFSKKTVILLICLSLSACHLRQIQERRTVNHVVLLWFEATISEKELAEIKTQALTLKRIPEIQALEIGSAILSERKIVDDSFHLALLFQFDSKMAMHLYLKNPAHKNFVHQYIKGKVKKILVYDF